MGSPQELRQRAERYRRLALALTDKQTVEALQDLAAECDALAAALEAAGRPSKPED